MSKKTKKQIEQIAFVCEKTGWKKRKAEKALNEAVKMGVSYFNYIKYEAWNLDNDELKDLAEKIKIRKEKRAERINIICSNTGWSEEEADAALKTAFKLGLKNFQYVKYEAWKLNEEELKELSEVLEERKKASQGRIDFICSRTGWNEDKAKEELSKAREMGINNFYYVKYEVWKLNEEEIKAVATEIEAKKEGHINNVIENTGWDREKAIAKMDEAKKIGISYWQYATKYLFELSEEELKEFADLLLKNDKANKDFYADIVMGATGWDKEKVVEELNKYKKLGASYFIYTRKRFYLQDDETIKKLLKKNNQNDKTVQVKNNEYIDKIMEKSGWSRGKVESEILRAKINCRANIEDYCMYNFHELTCEEQEKYITHGKFFKLIYKCNDFSKTGIFWNKTKSNVKFSEFIKRKWFSNQNLSYEEFLENIKGLNKIIVKPYNGFQGNGVEAFECNISEEENRKLYEYIDSLGISLIEEYLVQHNKMMELSDTSVNTVRIVTLNDNGTCKYVYSVLKMGGGSVVDNICKGGKCAYIDVKTGKLSTNAVDIDGNVFTKIPFTEKPIKGFQIPHWNKVLELCEKIAGKVEGVHLLGWDLAVLQDRIEIIEGNSFPAHDLPQLPFVPEKIGMADKVITPYL